MSEKLLTIPEEEIISAIDSLTSSGNPLAEEKEFFGPKCEVSIRNKCPYNPARYEDPICSACDYLTNTFNFVEQKMEKRLGENVESKTVMAENPHGKIMVLKAPTHGKIQISQGGAARLKGVVSAWGTWFIKTKPDLYYDRIDEIKEQGRRDRRDIMRQVKRLAQGK